MSARVTFSRTESGARVASVVLDGLRVFRVIGGEVYDMKQRGTVVTSPATRTRVMEAVEVALANKDK